MSLTGSAKKELHDWKRARELSKRMPRSSVEIAEGPPPAPFRFGIADLVLGTIIFGIYLGVGTALFVSGADDRPIKIAALAAICAAIVFGAAYLAARLATEKN